MSSQGRFHLGVQEFKKANYEESVKHFDAAISLGLNTVQVFDSRAAAFDKLDKIKDALQDAKKCISLNPDSPIGYIRSARLFERVDKLPQALAMVSMALDRLKAEDSNRKATMEALNQQLLHKQEEARLAAVKKQNHIQKLPIELLSQIFSFAVAEDLTGDGHLRFAAICSSWRDIIAATPSLWANLRLTNLRPTHKATLFKDHSRGRITRLELAHSLTNEKAERALSTLDSTARKTISILQVLGRQATILRFMRGIVYHPHLLRELHISDGDSPDPSEDLEQVLGEFASDQPEFSMERICTSETKLSQDMTWFLKTSLPKLRELVISVWISITIVYEILDHIPSLESLDLQGVPYDVGNPNPLIDRDTGITAPHLRTLSLQSSGPMDLFWFNLVAFPALTSFRITSQSISVEDCLDLLKPPSVLQQIETLRFQKCFFDGSMLIQRLSKMNSLSTLDIVTCGSNMSYVLDEMARSSSESLICPALQHLDVSRCTTLNAESCVRLVRSRLHLPTEDQTLPSLPKPLISLKLDGCPDLDAALIEWLRSKVPDFSAAIPRQKRYRNAQR